MLVVDGKLELEKRELGQERWRGMTLHPGALHFTSAQSTGYELRWRNRSARELALIHVELSDAILRRVANEHEQARSLAALAPKAGFCDGLLAELMLALGGTVDNPRDSDRSFADTALELLSLRLLREHADLTLDEHARRGGLTPVKLRQLVELIAANLSRTITLHELAREAQLSTYHFARAFKRSTGETPHRYIVACRLREAQRLLRQTQLPIAQVAALTGFASQAHMTHVFRRVLHVTPAQLRSH